jgi:hypothetical protein
VDVTLLPYFLKSACLKHLKELFPSVASPTNPSPEGTPIVRPKRNATKLVLTGTPHPDEDNMDDGGDGGFFEGDIYGDEDEYTPSGQQSMAPSAVVVHHSAEAVHDVVRTLPRWVFWNEISGPLKSLTICTLFMVHSG